MMEVFSKIGLFCLIRQSECFNWLVPVCSFTILNALVLVIHQISQSIIYVAPILSVILNVGSFWCCSLNDSRGGTLLLLLLLLFVNCYTSSHILYALYIFLCWCLLLIDRGTFRETIDNGALSERQSINKGDTFGETIDKAALTERQPIDKGGIFGDTQQY